MRDQSEAHVLRKEGLRPSSIFHCLTISFWSERMSKERRTETVRDFEHCHARSVRAHVLRKEGLRPSSIFHCLTISLVRAHVLRKEGLRQSNARTSNSLSLVRAHVLRKEGLRRHHLGSFVFSF